MSIYLENGYLDINKILSYKIPFNFIIGGRGTGKTYGALKYVYDSRSEFMLMRRTQAQCDLINKPEFNPFKALKIEDDYAITVKPIGKYNSSIILENEDEQQLLGYTCALSTIANMRGFNASDVKLLIYDEFIPEKHERKIKNEGSAFLNAYETINRNRELQNQDPVQVLCLANAFDIANAIFIELGLVSIAERMILKGNELFIDKNKGVLILLLNDSKISEAKKDTVLYRIAGTSFTEMALNNEFVYNSSEYIKSKPLKEYKLLCSVGEISIYKHKSNKQYYVSEHQTGSASYFGSDEIGLTKYRKNFGMRLWGAYMRNNMWFESMLAKSLFEIYTIK